MAFHEDIAAIRSGLGTSGDAGDARSNPTTSVRESRQVRDALARQFNTCIGPSVICLPMGDVTRDSTHGRGD